MAKRKGKTKPKRRRYSSRRLRFAALGLTLLSVVLFAVAALVIYHTLRFTALIDRRLAGESLERPTWVYARDFELRRGQRLGESELVEVMNELGYRRTASLGDEPATFALEEGEVRIRRRGDAAARVGVRFDRLWVSEILELRTGAPLDRVRFEPVPVATLFGEDRAKQRWVPLEEIPPHVAAAVLATEDRRFFDHTGLDPIGIVRALVADLASGELRQGGSTLTQQLVKNYFLTPERTIRRKLLEAYLAVILESRTSKEDILELYLNDVYLGQRGSFGIHGVAQAASIFFGKDVKNVGIAEAALIAAVIRSPNTSTPFRHAETALQRRNVVLDQMAEAGWLEHDAATAAKTEPLGVVAGTVDRGEAPYFVDALRARLAAAYDLDALQLGNLRVVSTMDRYLQNAAQSALVEGLEEIRGKLPEAAGGALPQAALVAMDPASGDIVALVGARSYGTSQFNRALEAHRQPGSAFKPFVYLAAFETDRGLGPASAVVDEPTTFRHGTRTWTPRNYSRRFEGRVTYRRALASSLNVATAKVGESVGFDRVVKLWEEMGMTSRLEPYPSLVLGAFEVTPLELTTAYAVLANGGLRVEPRLFTAVETAEGREIDAVPVETKRVVSEGAAYLVTDMMTSVLDLGTGRDARARGFSAEAAGKTGTTDDTRDAWFVGYTPDVLAAVWVGYDDNRPLGLSGAEAALPIWVRFMKSAVSGREKERFASPPGIVFAEIDPATGKIANASCPSRRREPFRDRAVPKERCGVH